jgi:hypothetical protein
VDGFVTWRAVLAGAAFMAVLWLVNTVLSGSGGGAHYGPGPEVHDATASLVAVGLIVLLVASFAWRFVARAIDRLLGKTPAPPA